MESIQGKTTPVIDKDYEADLAKNNTEEFNSNEPMAATVGEGYSYI